MKNCNCNLVEKIRVRCKECGVIFDTYESEEETVCQCCKEELVYYYEETEA